MEPITAAAGDDPLEPGTEAPEGSAPEDLWTRLAHLSRVVRLGFATKETGSLRSWR